MIADDPLPRVPPTLLQNAASTIQLEDGFAVELLAAEPLVTDPVAMVYDERGRAFVAEMNDYPFVERANDKPFSENTRDVPLGRIRLLEDVDGDGVFDKSTVFADQLSWPTGLAVWKGGLYVVATPDLWYLKDTNEDGIADERRKVFAGFRKFNVQAVINNLKWGLDHRLIAAGSSNGGKIVSEATPGQTPIVMGTGDFSFDPKDEAQSFELLAGGARFGNDLDDWGNRFICNIRNPIQHIVLPRSLMARNPYLPPVAAVQDVATAGDTVPVFRTSPPEPWRVLNAKRLIDDTSIASPRSESAATGYMTSACGVTVYRGDAFPREFYGTVFLGEVAGNLVHHQRLRPDSVTFSSSRTNASREFLSSSDNWFRPVNFVNAPDGTLHMLDMYRETIEHPWSIPDDIKDRLDLRSGSDRGRIYRIAPIGFRSNRPRPQLHLASIPELIDLLSHPAVWWRETADRLLYERHDPVSVGLLRKRLRQPSRGSASPEKELAPDFDAMARVRALWLLHGLNHLSDEDLMVGLRDSNPGVRENAAQLCTQSNREQAAIVDQLSEMAQSEDSMRCLMHVAFALGSTSESKNSEAAQRVVRPLASIAHRFSEDRWLRAAVLSSSTSIASQVASQLWQQRSFGKLPSERIWMYELGLIVGGRAKPSETKMFLDGLNAWQAEWTNRPEAPGVAEDGRLQAVRGLYDGMVRTKQNTKDLSRLFSAEHQQDLLATISDAATVARNRERTMSERLSALSLLIHADFSVAKETAVSLFDTGESSALQASAVRMLTSFRRDEVPTILMGSLRSLPASARAEAVEALLSRREWHPMLLDALENRTLRIGEIPHARRNLLLRSAAMDVKERAMKLFQLSQAPVQEILQRYRKELERGTGAAEQGRLIYRRECQNCHRMEGEGQDIGPSLTSLRNRTSQEVLLHILDPNREVAPNFISYTIAMEDGRSVSGIVVDDNVSAISVRTASGMLEVVDRNRIDQITSSGLSLMPDGLAERISPIEMNDLLSYIMGGSAR
jgi:putative membrane-bound dehydrogenase-like protein